MKKVMETIKKHLKKIIIGVVLFVITLGGSLVYKYLKNQPQEDEFEEEFEEDEL